ncbi:hypothetical protein [Streptomyces radicis]|uniref:Uncharacterized protein n=1 Tax=Streptomyces radicis TaxID=1750517 RepID=A0A3A9WT80_9ACTN|nr:hypothetical protein [Streptomyces radicis]RKN09327.1 hypothetical protein D7319_12760 [Streptomyces radicis]RKN23075.1 hypothetical protein D7318_13765 [Streptomyces radicis]
MNDEADLAVSAEGLDPVESAARGLYDRLPADGLAAESEGYAAGQSLRGVDLASGAAIVRLTERWRTQVLHLRSDCGRIAGHLSETVTAHAELESRTGDDVRRATTAGLENVAPNRAILALGGIAPEDGDA